MPGNKNKRSGICRSFLFFVSLLNFWILLTVGHVGGVEKLFGKFAAWFAKEVLVDLDDVRVVVGLADSALLVDGVEDVGSLLTVGIKDVSAFLWFEVWLDEWLTTAIDATAWAAHDLDEVIWGLAFFDLIEKNFGVLHARGDGDFDLKAVDFDFGFFDGVKASAGFEVDWAEFFSGQCVVSGTESSFHDAAGDTEDWGGTSVLSKKVLIELFFWKISEHDASAFDHRGELTSGDDGINIR